MQNNVASLNPNSTPKVVLITGSSSGIGQATALAFAKAGHKVIATIRNQNKAHALLASAEEAKVSLDIRLLDVCDDHSVNTCVNEVLKEYGHIDILVNNAGTGYRGTLEQTPIEDIKRMMDVNYYSVARLTKAVLPSMRGAGAGHIITVSSLGGVIAVPFCDAYCAAKFAVEGMMESLAPVAAAFGVKVSLIEPGPVNTNFLNNVEGKKSSSHAENPYENLEKAYIQSQLQRFATMSQHADEIAHIIVDAAKANQPHLRYPTSTAALQFAQRKYIDATGDSIIQATTQLILQASNA